MRTNLWIHITNNAKDKNNKLMLLVGGCTKSIQEQIRYPDTKVANQYTKVGHDDFYSISTPHGEMVERENCRIIYTKLFILYYLFKLFCSLIIFKRSIEALAFISHNFPSTQCYVCRMKSTKGFATELDTTTSTFPYLCNKTKCSTTY